MWNGPREAPAAAWPPRETRAPREGGEKPDRTQKRSVRSGSVFAPLD